MKSLNDRTLTIRHSGPGLNGVWNLRVVKFPVKHSPLYNKQRYYTPKHQIRELYPIAVVNKFIYERERVSVMTVLRSRADLYGKQVFYCTNNCTISLYICTVICTVICYSWMVKSDILQQPIYMKDFKSYLQNSLFLYGIHKRDENVIHDTTHVFVFEGKKKQLSLTVKNNNG